MKKNSCKKKKKIVKVWIFREFTYFVITHIFAKNQIFDDFCREYFVINQLERFEDTWKKNFT